MYKSIIKKRKKLELIENIKTWNKIKTGKSLETVNQLNYFIKIAIETIEKKEKPPKDTAELIENLSEWIDLKIEINDRLIDQTIEKLIEKKINKENEETRKKIETYLCLLHGTT